MIIKVVFADGINPKRSEEKGIDIIVVRMKKKEKATDIIVFIQLDLMRNMFKWNIIYMNPLILIYIIEKIVIIMMKFDLYNLMSLLYLVMIYHHYLVRLLFMIKVIFEKNIFKILD